MHHITTFFVLFVSNPVIMIFGIVESLENKTSIQCRTNMTSTCADYKITKWNKKDVGRHLKNWIKSVLIEWNANEQSLAGKHCKAFIVKRNTFFNQYAPDAVSPNVIILAKIKQQNDAKTTKNTFEKYNRNIPNTPKFYGPIWADLSNSHEWGIERHPNNARARLSPDAILGNGLYYGFLNNDEMKLGK